VPDSDTNGLKGRTLKIYVYIVKERKPVGPSDVMRGVNLTSPSVAYRHLQKLENMGLLVKNEHGNYVARAAGYQHGTLKYNGTVCFSIDTQHPENVIPEFSSWMVLPLLLAATGVSLILRRSLKKIV
jgi:hypothetical protein